MKTLFINACIREESRTLKLAKYLLEIMEEPYEELVLEKIKMEPLTGSLLIERNQLLEKKKYDHELFKMARDFSLADRIVVAAPYYDRGFPALLKTYIENIMISGITFEYLIDGSIQSLCKARQLIYVTTAGGPITEDDFGFPYLENLAMDYFSIPGTYSFTADNLDVFPQKVDAILNKTKHEMDIFVKRELNEFDVLNNPDCKPIREENKLKAGKKFLERLMHTNAAVGKILQYNFKTNIIFIILYTIVMTAAASSVVNLGATIARKLYGSFYVANDNLFRFLTAPGSIIVAIITSLILTYFVLFEVSGLVYAHSRSRAGLKISLREIISAGYITGKKVYTSFKNLPLIVFLLVLMPITGFMAISSSGLNWEIPEYLNDTIIANKLYTALFSITYIILVIVVVFLIFSIPDFILGKSDFFMACKNSLKITKGRLRRAIGTAIGVMFSYNLLYIGATAILAVILAVGTQIIEGARIIFSNTFLGYFSLFGTLVYYILAPMVNTALLTELYYKYMDELEHKPGGYKKSMKKAYISDKSLSILIGFVVVILLSTLYINRENLYLYNKNSSRPAIIAHRGDSVRCPENTMPAFELALQEMPDWIELDVHETKDGIIVVSHDDNLRRVSGKNIYVHESTYEELMQIDVGSWFSEEFSWVRLSTLTEVLQLYKGKIPVQIELKPTEYDDGLEEKVLQIIKDNGMEDECIITSQNAACLKRIKEISPDTITVYSIFVALGQIEDLDYVDYYTVEEFNISETFVNRIHKAGKKVFVWTVNRSKNVQKPVYCNVDGILTDDPVMLNDSLDAADYEGGLKRIFSYIMESAY